MTVRLDLTRSRAGTAPAGRARRELADRGLRRGPVAMLAAFLLGGAVCSMPTAAEELSGKPAGEGRPANAVEMSGILARIDTVLAGLEARIEDIRAQAEKMLDHADAAANDADQMRFEEMYGRLVAAAEELEGERDRLRSMRAEFAAAGDQQRP